MKNLKCVIYLYRYPVDRILNSFNTSCIAVFLIETTGVNELHLFNDFWCIFTVIESFRSCTQMGFRINALGYYLGIRSTYLESLLSFRDVDGPRDLGLLERRLLTGFSYGLSYLAYWALKSMKCFILFFYLNLRDKVTFIGKLKSWVLLNKP